MRTGFKYVLKRTLCVVLCGTMIFGAAGCKKKSKKTEEKTIFDAKEIIGKHVYYGEFDQNDDASDGKEAIEWQVLDQKGTKLLLISAKVLAVTNYSSESESDWEKSDLRDWLNSTFLSDAFSAEQAEKISSTKISTGKNSVYDTETKKSADTNDKVFILDDKAAQKYFENNPARVCSGTFSVVKAGLQEFPGSSNHSLYWVLRTPGRDMGRVCAVNYDGRIENIGVIIGTDAIYGVRPCIWVDASEFVVKE